MTVSRRLNWIRLVGPHWPALSVAFVAMLVEAGAGLLEPWPLKVIFDHVLADKPLPWWLARWPGVTADRITLLDAAAIAVVAIALDRRGGVVRRVVPVRPRPGLRSAATFAALCIISCTASRSHSTNSARRATWSRELTGDVDTAYDFVSSALLGGTFDVLMLASMLVVMLSMDWRFTLVSLAIAPPLFITVYTLTRRIKSSTRAARKQEAEIASVALEALSAMRTIKAFTAEEFEESRLDEASGTFVRLAMQRPGAQGAPVAGGGRHRRGRHRAGAAHGCAAA